LRSCQVCESIIHLGFFPGLSFQAGGRVLGLLIRFDRVHETPDGGVTAGVSPLDQPLAHGDHFHTLLDLGFDLAAVALDGRFVLGRRFLLKRALDQGLQLFQGWQVHIHQPLDLRLLPVPFDRPAVKDGVALNLPVARTGT
jgi:hypothetical protein